MVENRTVRKIALKTPGYREKRGRSREAVLEKMKDKGTADWERKAMDRKNWKRITKFWA